MKNLYQNLNRKLLWQILLIYLISINSLQIVADKLDLKSGIQTVCLPKEGKETTLSYPPCTNKIPVDVYTPENKKLWLMY